MLRLPDGMRDRIKDAAAANNRSMNAEIVSTLEEKYPDPGRSHRKLLAMTLDFLIDEGLTPKTPADKDRLLASIDALPEGEREDVASQVTDEIMVGLERLIAKYRRSHSPPPSDDD